MDLGLNWPSRNMQPQGFHCVPSEWLPVEWKPDNPGKTWGCLGLGTHLVSVPPDEVYVASFIPCYHHVPFKLGMDIEYN